MVEGQSSQLLSTPKLRLENSRTFMTLHHGGCVYSSGLQQQDEQCQHKLVHIGFRAKKVPKKIHKLASTTSPVTFTERLKK